MWLGPDCWCSQAKCVANQRALGCRRYQCIWIKPACTWLPLLPMHMDNTGGGGARVFVRARADSVAVCVCARVRTQCCSVQDCQASDVCHCCSVQGVHPQRSPTNAPYPRLHTPCRMPMASLCSLPCHRMCADPGFKLLHVALLNSNELCTFRIDQSTGALVRSFSTSLLAPFERNFAYYNSESKAPLPGTA